MQNKGTFGPFRQVLVGVAASGLFFIASFALADIVSSSFSTGTSANITITQLSLAKPAGTVAGDFMLAQIDTKNGTAANIVAPTGWTLIARTDNGTDVGIASYWKVASSSEPATFTWNITPQTRAVGGIVRYTGVDATNPIDVFAGATGRGNTLTAPSVTTASTSEQIVALYAIGDGSLGSNVFSTPTGMAEKYEVSNPIIGPASVLDEVLQVSAGATGNKVSTVTGPFQHNWVAQQIALRKMPPQSIAFKGEAHVAGYLSGGVLTANYDLSTAGSNVTLIMFVCGGETGATAPANITWDGVNLVQVGTTSYGSAGNCPGSQTVWGLSNAHAVNGNLVLSGADGKLYYEGLVWYSGTSSTFPDNYVDWNHAVATSWSQAITTNHDNAWTIMLSQQDNGGETAILAGTSTIIRNPAVGTIGDSNGPIHPAGTTTLNMNYNFGTPADNYWMVLSIAPAN